MGDFTGKVVAVTGGTSGIGYAAAKTFLDHGASVVIGGRHIFKGAAAAERLGGPDRVRFFAMDAASEEDVRRFVAYAVESFGRLDVAVASAGISGFTLDVYDTEVWKQTLETNLYGVFYLNKYAVEQMRRQGGGAIVNVGSATSVVGNAGTVCYPAAKHGVAGLTKSAAITHARENIRVNCVVPGFVTTPLTAGVPEEDFARNLAMVPMGRAARPEEIAAAIRFLAGDEASYVTGSLLTVDGGYTAQ
ncbi:MAG: SDR family oxidoreductase [Oscillospiraceae bacterium]|nr:SDR family oxidoreductase [Oscillospiraceae bacterium]